MAYIRVAGVWVDVETQSPSAAVHGALALAEIDSPSAVLYAAQVLVEVNEATYDSDDNQSATSVAGYVELDGGDSQSSTSVGSYVELTGGDYQSATHVGSYVEITGGDNQSATGVALYIELVSDNDNQSATVLDAYIEIDGGDNVSATHAGIYVEVETGAVNYVSSTQTAAYIEFYDGPAEVVVSKVAALLGTQDGGANISQFATYVEYITEGIYVTKFGVLVEVDEVDSSAVGTQFERTKTKGRASHIRLPTEVVGYALDPSWSFWSIITPEATENLLLNPSFEENAYTTGGHVASLDWASVSLVEGAFPYATRGLRFVRMTPNGAQATAEFYYDYDVTAGENYTWSLDLFLRLAHTDRIRLRILSGGSFTTIDAAKTVQIHQEGWQRHHLSWTANQTTTIRLMLYVTTLNLDNSHYVCTDGWQLENKKYPTTYADGSMFATNDTATRRHFWWTGRPNLSTSHRTVDAEGHGRVWNLSEEFLFYTTSIVGLGMVTPELLLRRVGTQGLEVYQGAYDRSRDFTIIGVTIGCDFGTLIENRDAFINLLRNNRNNSRTQIKIRWQPTDAKGIPWGRQLEILCAYREGLSGQITNLYQETLPVQFHAADPYLEESIEMSAKLELPTNIAETDYLYRSTTGSWGRLVGTTAPDETQFGGADGVVDDVIFDREGRPVICGYFDHLSGSDVDFIGYWDGTDWQQYGATAPDGRVTIMHKNTYDGELVIGGDFTNVGQRIVKYDSSAGDWATTLGTINAVIYGIDSDERNYIYVGGDFTNLGYGRIVAHDTTTFRAIGDGFDAAVYTVKVGRDGYLYAGGRFQNDLLANTMNGVARWNLNNSAWSDAWEDIGVTSGEYCHSLDIGPDGHIYGLFSDLATDSSLRRWDGTRWTTIASGTFIRFQQELYFDTHGVGWLSSIDFALPGDYNWANRFYANTLYPVDFTARTTGGVDLTPAKIDVDKDGEILMGFWDGGSVGDGIDAGKATTITYPGTANVYPTLCIYGGCNLVSIINHTTGGEIWFRNDQYDKFTVALDEEVYIYLDGGRMRAWSSKRGNIAAYVQLNFSNLANWYLRPGENNISVYCKDTDSATRVFLKWRNRYLSMDSTVA